MNELLLRLEKPVQNAFALGVKNARNRAQIKVLENAVIAGDIDKIMEAAGIRDGMWSPLTESIRNVYAAGGEFAMTAGAAKRLKTEFDINNPRAEAWLKQRSSQMVTGFLLPEQRAAIQTMLEAGMFAGKNPRSTALDIVGRIGANGKRTGGVIGLTQQQTQFVLNMADDLENFDERYFDRKLRDRRYDRSVRKSFDAGVQLPKGTRDKIVSRYSERMLKHRGDTIGRTETLRAISESKDEALRQVVEDGLAPKEAISRIWRHSFSPGERPGHVKLEGTEKGLDELFTNPDTGAQLRYPHDPQAPASETINCRCYLEDKIDFIAVEKAA